MGDGGGGCKEERERLIELTFTGSGSDGLIKFVLRIGEDGLKTVANGEVWNVGKVTEKETNKKIYGGNGSGVNSSGGSSELSPHNGFFFKFFRVFFFVLFNLI